MSSLEMNKIAAAVLTAGVVAMGSGFIANLLIYPKQLEENVYVVATTDDEEAGAETAAADSGPASVLPLLAAADIAEGQKVARKCTACHTFEQGAANKIGPNLWNIVGQAKAAVDGFRYSSAFEDVSDQTWGYEELDAFLANPRDYVPGTKMSFAGLRKIEDRAAIIAYMRSQSDSPIPLPAAEEASATEGVGETEGAGETEAPAMTEATEAVEQAAEAASEAVEQAVEAAGEAVEQAAEAAGDAVNQVAEAAEAAVAQVSEAADGGFAALLAAADPEAGAKVARKCTACHTFEQGGKNKLGPNLYNIVGMQVAANPDFRYSKALQEKSGEVWSYENLSAYLESPRTWAPGTKMVFAGLRKPEDRAALIAFLRSHHDNPPPLPE